MWETWIQSLGPEDPLEEGMATYSSILAWRIPCTEEPDGLQSVGLQRVGHDWATNTFPVVQVRYNERLNRLLVIKIKGEGNGTPLQDSCLENPMDGGAQYTAVHGVAEGWTRLSDFTFTFHFHALQKEMATHSSVLAWRIPGTRSLVGCRLHGHTESDTTQVT